MQGLAFAHEVTRTWFKATFGQPTEAQERAWPEIASGKSTLLLAPTGSGKTLSAFLVALDRLCFGSHAATEGKVRVVYVSPLKALGNDVEKNLALPLSGLRATAEAMQVPIRIPTTAVRTGDTPTSERVRMRHNPPEILITTPESLYLLLASPARAMLDEVETLIVDEIHSLVPTKRGVHLAITLERMEDLRKSRSPLQRIGLSATQNPLEEVALYLGGLTGEVPRHVEIVDARGAKAFEMKVEEPLSIVLARAVEEMMQSGVPANAKTRVKLPSLWDVAVPILLRHIETRRSTMIFVNSRSLTERLAELLNNTTDDGIVALAHHGSLAKEVRLHAEQALKSGTLKSIVATASLELGIDVGAVDLTMQIAPPPSVSAALQRLGRSGHQVGAISRGLFVPRSPGELLSLCAITADVAAREVETTCFPRNALDVLAQQLIACVAQLGETNVEHLYGLMRRAAPYAHLERKHFDDVVDMISGYYPSAAFGGLAPKVTRNGSRLVVRPGTEFLVRSNVGTIPDRGLYPVFTQSASGDRLRRVGELDEEMVWESRIGDTFRLGASSWQIEAITTEHVRVIPTQDPGELPFWKGDALGRPASLGKKIGALARVLQSLRPVEAQDLLQESHYLTEAAAAALLGLLKEQRERSVVPTDKTIVVERWMKPEGTSVAVLTPLGRRVHLPWGNLLRSRFSRDLGIRVDLSCTDDGMLFTFYGTSAPSNDAFFPTAQALDEELLPSIPTTPLFAARFRENAARALLLPRGRPGKRSPLVTQRRRSARLLQVASEFSSFPIMRETLRELVFDHFDLATLRSVLAQIESGEVEIRTVTVTRPSPFAGELLSLALRDFIDAEDVPLDETKARALQLDAHTLQTLLGKPDYSRLLDEASIDAAVSEANHLERPLRDGADLQALLLRRGPTQHETLTRLPGCSEELLCNATRQNFVGQFGGLIYASQEASLVHTALLRQGSRLSRTSALLQLLERAMRFRPPSTAAAIANELEIQGDITPLLQELVRRGGILFGSFGNGLDNTFVAVDMLERIKRHASLRARKATQPVSLERMQLYALKKGRVLALNEQRPRALSSEMLETLEGIPLSFDVLERKLLPARGVYSGSVADARRSLSVIPLDAFFQSGEWTWRGAGSGFRAKLVIARSDRFDAWLDSEKRRMSEGKRPASEAPSGNEEPLAGAIVRLLKDRGALFFREIKSLLPFTTDQSATLAGDAEIVKALWHAIWNGDVSSDSLDCLRNHKPTRDKALPWHKRMPGRFFLTQRGRAETNATSKLDQSKLLLDVTETLLERHGVLLRSVASRELEALGVPLGYSALYPVLRKLEDVGRVRRGEFVQGGGSPQFAMRSEETALRQTQGRGVLHVVHISDPALLWGAAFPWPEFTKEAAQAPSTRPTRQSEGWIVLREGFPIGHYAPAGIRSFVQQQSVSQSELFRDVARALAHLVSALNQQVSFRLIDDVPAWQHEHFASFEQEKFRTSYGGRVQYFEAFRGEEESE